MCECQYCADRGEKECPLVKSGAQVASTALLEMFDAHELEVQRMLHGRWLCRSLIRTGDDDTFYGDTPTAALRQMIESISNAAPHWCDERSVP